MSKTFLVHTYLVLCRVCNIIIRRYVARFAMICSTTVRCRLAPSLQVDDCAIVIVQEVRFFGPGALRNSPPRIIPLLFHVFFYV